MAKTVHIDAVKPRSLGEWIEKSLGRSIRSGPLYEGAKRQYDAYVARSQPVQAPASAATTDARAATVPESVSQPFERALETLSGTSGDVERMYQSGKRQTMSNLAMGAVSRGMANVLNMPAAELAYEREVRPGVNVALAGQKAGVLQNLGQVAAGIYGTNVGAQTSRYGIDVGAQTSRYAADVGAGSAAASAGLQFASNRANQSLQRYIADLNASTRIRNTSPVPTLGAPTL